MPSVWSPSRRSLIAAVPGVGLAGAGASGLFGAARAGEPVDQQAPITLGGVQPGGEALAPLKSWFDPFDRPTAEVRLNGRGPYRFLVDSAATTTVLASAIALELGLQETGSVHVAGVTGEMTMPTSRISRLEVGAIQKSDVRVALSPRELGIRGAGILGADVFAGRRLVFDIAAKTVRIGYSQRSAFVADRPNLILRDGVFAEIRGLVGRVPTRMILDTGAECSIANPALARALRAREPRMTEIKNVSLYGLTGETMQGDALYLPRMQLGEAGIRGAVALAADAPIFAIWKLADEPALIVGADLLSGLPKFTIDYGAGQFSIGQLPPSRSAFNAYV
jgi:hypothetical protein